MPLLQPARAAAKGTARGRFPHLEKTLDCTGDTWKSSAMPGDTLAYARRLEAAGVAAEQAEAHTEAARDAATESAATRAATKTDLRAAVAELRVELTWRMALLGGAMIAAIELIP